MKTYRIYIAGPLFSVAEREYNIRLVRTLKKLEPNFTFVLPQEYAREIYGQQRFTEKVFEYCMRSISTAKAMICILEGPDVDSGTCIEMGFAYAHKIPIIGIRTDFRSSEDKGVNLMVSNVCSKMIWLPNTKLGVLRIAREIAVALDNILG